MIKQEEPGYMKKSLCKNKLARDTIRYWLASKALSRQESKKNKDLVFKAIEMLDKLLANKSLRLRKLSLRKLKELQDEQERSDRIS